MSFVDCIPLCRDFANSLYSYVKLLISPAAKYGLAHHLDTMPNPKNLIGIIQVLLRLRSAKEIIIDNSPVSLERISTTN